MSNVSTEQQQDLPPDSVEADEHGASVGLYLAGQRRLRGISVEELSARTRIPRRNLERLEAGAFDTAPDGFSRGFVRTVAVALGLDADEAVTRLMAEPQADDAVLIRERRVRFVVRVAVLGTAILVGAAGFKILAALAAPSEPAPDSSVVYRADPVRDLAARQPLFVPAEAAAPDTGEAVEAPVEALAESSAATQIAAPIIADSD